MLFHTYSISPASVLETCSIADSATKEAIQLDQAVWPLPLLMSRILPLLHRGLDKRIKLLVLLPMFEEEVTRS